MCHCYSNLHPFQCEEEEGSDLMQINCLDQKKVPSNSGPLLTSLTRSSRTTTKDEKQQKTEFKTFDDELKACCAQAMVLIGLALGVIVCLMCKTYFDNRKKKMETPDSPIFTIKA